MRPDLTYPIGSAVLQIRWTLPDDRRQPFESWYDEVHFPEMLSLPGCLAARRFSRVTTAFSSPTDYQAVVTYQLRSPAAADGEDLRALAAVEPNARTRS